MKIIELSKGNSVFQQFLAELRDENIQKDSLRFRKNLERCGEIVAYEISKTLVYNSGKVKTSLGTADVKVLASKLVLGTILRAGLPFHQGFLNFFDKAENAFITAYRKYYRDNTFEVIIDYVACPALDDKELILCDPMLATGHTVHKVYKYIQKHGTPKHTHLVFLVASPEAVEYMKKNFTEDVTMWIGCIDKGLDAHSYILPGLGDAGDLAFGEKM